VEDNLGTSSLVADWLKHEKHIVELAFTGQDARAKLRLSTYDLIILDWALPDDSGPQICDEFRLSGGVAPVLMLTIKAEIKEKEVGFEAGADDYLTKPFNLRELSARVKALIRRPHSFADKTITFADLVLDRSNHRIYKNGERIHLAPKEYAILELLLLHPGHTFSPEALRERLWHSDSESEMGAVFACVRRLRQKLDGDGGESIIESIKGVGYRINVP